jgi:hypothetical protein
MISAQWAKGHGGIYRYYRCSRKKGTCGEPYTQERFVTDQCLEILKPLAISSEDADRLRALIDEETGKDGKVAQKGLQNVTERLAAVQEKLNKLTRAYLDEVIDEESYQSAKTDLVTEKAALKQEKQRLHKTGFSYWNEPAKDVVNALESAGKAQSKKSLSEIAGLVQKIGTNRLLSRKTVTFSLSEPYALTASILASPHIPTHEPVNAALRRKLVEY